MNYLYTNRRSVGIFGGLLLLILFSCCGIGRAAAQQQGAEQRIMLSMRDTAISDILENITKRYQYAFITRTANVDTNARVSIDVVDEPLRAVLDRIFAGQEVAFEFDGRLVRISKAAVPPPSSASTIAVSGVVRDGSGNPLAGVTVMVAGTYKGVTTDNDGRYALRVDGEASVLQFLYLGYKNVEETVGKRTTIDVAMEEDLKMVDEVVVIGYGTQSRKTLTTSISKIDGDKLYGAPVSTVGDALKGKVAGLRVATNSSLSGEAPRFLIRGGSSINMGNDPIYIVDGALRDDLSGVNPNDIESMEVLKDAASAAIYGARASNGVIIVTTKKGSPSQGPQVVFDVQVGFSAPTKKWDLLTARADRAGASGHRQHLRQVDRHAGRQFVAGRRQCRRGNRKHVEHEPVHHALSGIRRYGARRLRVDVRSARQQQGHHLHGYRFPGSMDERSLLAEGVHRRQRRQRQG